MNHVFKLSLLAAAIVSTSAQAEEFRQHDAHVHGSVELNIAQDGNELLMEIHAPGADVVGFESAPKNAEQKQQIENALSVLNQADKVMTLSSAAQCKPVFTEVRHTLGEDDGHDDKHDHDKHDEHHDDDKHDHDKHDEHHDDDKHDHDKHDEHHDDDKHDHDKHDEHHDDDKHDHDKHDAHHDDDDKHNHDKNDHEEHEEDGGHGEFIVEYHFDCGSIAKLNQIDTQWFNHFPSTESISVNMITEKAQIATKMSKNNDKVSF
ncbi:DUF2796 domain-containing protein [Vibrio sp. S9_S30]|uniref:zinc uptake protein ZrgA n=1 Tax=Vibrio sp. S9_S30 TaxID=2720226 RepID=UPI00168129BF|nr:DUF2796 domain-containing protein [Vibrio sp. S9_S30]MBD1557292.1 DUF2796 domain-containing protein [Vibrio sp. S9_S30]